ncbi:MAG: MotA/TolQ/ExbB proton channel family protein [Candidatus Eisenbacteria bacterium]|nr:MotA/TolQ/ExbB proton channel family protein [Candidatus Eisenbacteria bacterium]MCC7142894.1 MotA/TolQ/ExbB proton channel family protein [Candidatus Eisenbacteria bacterium]
MKSYVFIPILAASLAISFYIYSQLPEHIRAGGPLIAILITLIILVTTFVVERLIVLWRAGGRGDMAGFIRGMKKQVDAGNIPGAIEICKKQGGCLANVVGAGLERYNSLQGSALEKDEVLEETKRAIEEANALESPLLERNLIALSTIASVATMIGLLGTTTGMIKSFSAMSNAGAPDASKLALGISEALWNTALGLFTGIVGIIMYNYFTNRVDSYNYSMDETTYEVMQLLRHRKER